MPHRSTKVLVVSPHHETVERIKSLLLDYRESSYEVFHCASIDEKFPQATVAIVDEDAIDRDPEIHLARISFELYPVPLIYLTEKIDNEDSFKSIKSLAADYLIKGQLTGAVLHNCLKYAIESTRLRLELEKQQNRYKSLFYNSIDAAFFLNEDWTVENVNTSFSNIFETDFTRTKGAKFETFFKEQEDFLRIKNSQSLEERNQVDIEAQFQIPGKSRRFLGHLKISALREFDAETESRKTVGFHGTLSNISYRERMRKVKERADKVGMTYRLARALAHEIRNPLTNINLALEQIRDDTPIGEEGEVYIGIIERCTKRIDKLIGQLLTSSQKKQLEKKLCNFKSIIEEVAAEAADRGRLKNIKIITDVEDLPEFACEMDKIKLALSNLATNAIEAIEDEEGQIIIGAYREHDYLYIYVEDSGKGMSEEVQERLFDPFFTGKKKGLGLGLTATQTIISEHEGQIEVESSEGHGSIFTISLPFFDGTPTSEAEAGKNA